MDIFTAPFEVKFADKGAAGEFEGYGAFFDNLDSHGDKIAPGAFGDTLSERKAQGRGNPPMRIMHGGSLFGGDATPAGVWKHVGEDSKGLFVKGKISGAETTEKGKHLLELVRDGALQGISIGWSQRKNGTVIGNKPEEPKRLLKSVNLHEISLVDDPSNPLSTITSIKAAPAGVFDEMVRLGLMSGLSEFKARAEAEAFVKRLHDEPAAGLDAETKSALEGLKSFSLPTF